MTPQQATEVSGRSKSWLQGHACAWCNQTLWAALRHGCAAMHEKCDPVAKDYSPKGRLQNATQEKT